MQILFVLLMLAAGVFCIFCAVKDYDFFMESSKAALFVKLFGRNGARVFYIILGIVILVAGLCFGVSGESVF